MADVFVSYRQLHDAERARVRGFAERLRSHGINVILDQFYLDEHPGGPPEKWSKWSSDQAARAERVIIIGSEAWFQCFEGTQPAGSGLGAAYEADDIRTRLYKSANINESIRIVLLEDLDARSIPGKLEGYHRFHGDRDFGAIVRWLGGLPAGSPSSAKTSTPNNLPRLQYFFGRETELRKIADALAADARGWGVLIDGPGGIGKTALAVRAAELVPVGRFKRIIFLSSKERELTADGQRALGYFVIPTYLEMLNAVARELGQPELLKSIEAERPEVLLRALRSVNALLVLDNLETLPEPDRDQLFTFLNRLPYGSCAIVTSRRRADASAVTIRLDRLHWNAAAALIGELARELPRLARASDGERHALYEETGGNPLLIRWIAGQLGRGRCQSLEDALIFLRGTPPSESPLEFIFGDLLDTFTAAEEQVLASFTYFSQPIEVQHIAEIAGLTDAAAQTALSDLAMRALVVTDSEERRFALVPMVAEFLRRVRADTVAKSGRRLRDFAYASIVENGGRNHARFHVLDSAWPMVGSALPLLVSGDHTKIRALCIQLLPFLLFTGRWDEYLWLLREAEAKAVAAGDNFSAGWRAYHVGVMHSRRGQIEQCEACVKRAEISWQSSGGQTELGAVARLQGEIRRLRGDDEGAMAAFQQALDHIRAVAPRTDNVAICLSLVGATARRLGHYETAQLNYYEALDIARATNFSECVAMITGELALLAIERSDWKSASSFSREALDLAEDLGRQDIIAVNQERLATALVHQGQVVAALQYARHAVATLSRLGSERVEQARKTLALCEARFGSGADEEDR
jgi:ATP/maltotriose-dependent transcriptional regulator MalT